VNDRVLHHASERQAQVESIQGAAETWSPQQVLNWAFERFGNRVAISSAFGAEGMVLIDMASRLRTDFRLFTIDTEFLFPETYNLMDRIEQKYGIAIERAYSVLSPEEQEGMEGPELWARDPDRCCNLRKVEPLRRKLSELSAWITSIRRDQTSSRSSARRIDWDPRPRCALQRAPQPGLSEHRLHALYACGASGRRSARRALARIRQDRVRTAHH